VRARACDAATMTPRRAAAAAAARAAGAAAVRPLLRVVTAPRPPSVLWTPAGGCGRGRGWRRRGRAATAAVSRAALRSAMPQQHEEQWPPIDVLIDEPADVDVAAAAAASFCTGPPEQLFFIHGWPDEPSLWQSQSDYFSSRGYRCLRVTLPHYGGRAAATVSGDSDAPWDSCNWGTLTSRLTDTVRRHCQGRRVVLVIHDWGSVYGFFLQLMAPELVKAVVAMDVGPWRLAGKLQNVPPMLMIGLAYQVRAS
jgi:hypothetical protein